MRKNEKLRFTGLMLAIWVTVGSTAFGQRPPPRYYTNAEERYALAHIDTLLTQNKYVEARAYCDAYAGRFAASNSFQISHLDVLVRSGDHLAAKVLANQLKRSNPHDALVWFALRGSLSAQEQSEKVLAYFKNSEYRNYDVNPYFTYSPSGNQQKLDFCWYLVIGMQKEARKVRPGMKFYYVEQAIRMQPQNPLANYVMGLMLFRDAQYAFGEDPNSPELQKAQQAIPYVRIAYANSTGKLRANARGTLRMLTKNREGKLP